MKLVLLCYSVKLLSGSKCLTIVEFDLFLTATFFLITIYFDFLAVFIYLQANLIKSNYRT